MDMYEQEKIVVEDRSKSLLIRGLTLAERNTIKQAAKADGYSVQDWCRGLLVSAASGAVEDANAETIGASDEHLPVQE